MEVLEKISEELQAYLDKTASASFKTEKSKSAFIKKVLSVISENIPETTLKTSGQPVQSRKRGIITRPLGKKGKTKNSVVMTEGNSGKGDRDNMAERSIRVNYDGDEQRSIKVT